MSETYEYDKKPAKPHTCPAIGSQEATVCLPVTISPYAATGPSKVECCGQPEVHPCCDYCHGKINGTCEFTISQKIRVDIPVEFGATVNIGGTYVECECGKGKDCDCDKHRDCDCDKAEGSKS